MNPNAFPTKGNLILAKNSLGLATQGYELMDKKRNILMRELMELIEEAKDIQAEINRTFKNAYSALQQANIQLGIHYVEEVAASVPEEEGLSVKVRSIMGTEIPLVQMEEKKFVPSYTFFNTTQSLDDARLAFEEVKKLVVKLASVETAAYRLADNIKKTQKRANALQNITIPAYETLAVDISNALEEKEREEFIRLKVVKKKLR